MVIIKYYMYFLTKSEVNYMYGICVKIVIRNWYNVYFKELHNDQDTIDRQHSDMGSRSFNYY